MIRIVLALASVAALAPAVALGQGDDQAVGQRFEVRIQDLPKPFATRSSSNPSRAIERPSGCLLYTSDAADE